MVPDVNYPNLRVLVFSPKQNITEVGQQFSSSLKFHHSFPKVCLSQFCAVRSFTEILPSDFDFFSRPLSHPRLSPVLGGLFFHPTAFHLALPLRSAFFHPFLLTLLTFWATLCWAYWHRLVVDDYFAVITHTHAQDLLVWITG